MVAKVDVYSDGRTTVLYSGKVDGISSNDIVVQMMKDGADVRVINKTTAAKFLESPKFLAAVSECFSIDSSYFWEEAGAEARAWLFDGEKGAWAQTSKRFVDATPSGSEVRLLSSFDLNPDGVFLKTELPALQRWPPKTAQLYK